MTMRGLSAARGPSSGAAAVEEIDLDDDLIAQVDKLASVRTRDLVLPPSLLNFYGSTTYRARSNTMVEVGVGMVAINLISLGFDWVMPSATAPLVACRIVVVLAFLGAILGFRSSWGCGREGVLVIAPLVTMIALAGACGLYDGPVALERLLLNALFVTGSYVVLASIRPRDTMLLVVLAIGLFAGFLAASPGHTVLEKAQIATFYSLGLLGLGHARLITNKIQQRLFVLDLSGRLKVREVYELNARLYDAARTDPLTGIGNRRFFDETFAALTARGGAVEPLALFMIDIDHFKKLNDVLGHGRGDDCLRVVASALKDTLGRERDVVARFGGEEFVALLPVTSLEAAAMIAERLRLAVYVLDLPNPSSPWRRVTVSVGVAATPHAPVGDLVRCADEALYQAKQLGRDRVFIYETLAWNEALEADAA